MNSCCCQEEPVSDACALSQDGEPEQPEPKLNRKRRLRLQASHEEINEIAKCGIAHFIFGEQSERVEILNVVLVAACRPFLILVDYRWR